MELGRAPAQAGEVLGQAGTFEPNPNAHGLSSLANPGVASVSSVNGPNINTSRQHTSGNGRVAGVVATPVTPSRGRCVDALCLVFQGIHIA